MQFQVPQFIELEDKIIGPLTLKQFFFLAGTGLISFLLFFVLQLWLWLIMTTILAILAIAFAFLKYNGRPMILTFLAAAQYTWNPKFYLWQSAAISAQDLPELPNIKLARRQKLVEKPLENLWEKMNTTTQPIEEREKFSLALFKKREPVEQYEVQRSLEGDRRVYRRVDYR
ncbi:MAG: PrgI family protein [Candidatus Harrisonbacteria bacterium]|nr:PrgI family protein [Candidatus Harrisonbacteria bacterium]